MSVDNDTMCCALKWDVNMKYYGKVVLLVPLQGGGTLSIYRPSQSLLENSMSSCSVWRLMCQ